MNILNWLSLRRKAVVPFVIGMLGIVTLYLQLTADGSLSSSDWQTLIGALIGVVITVFGVHQATNAPVDAQ